MEPVQSLANSWLRNSVTTSVLRPKNIQRWLNLHEYQSKELMDKYKLPTQIGYTASNAAEVKQHCRTMLNKGIDTVVLKSQILAGGRGKGNMSSGLKGGIQFTRNPEQAEQLASKMFGYFLRTHQTGPEGLKVNKILLAEGVDIEKELYLAIILDRSAGGPVIVASQQGGVEIEEVASTNPEAVKVIPVDISKGLTPRVIAAVCEALYPDIESTLPKNAQDLSPRQKLAIFKHVNHQTACLLKKLYDLFIEQDASQIEINPLAITTDDRVLCVDAKLNFDDNAAFRQKALFSQEDISTRCPREVGAEEMGMNYITMDGNIGCLVNGAGLAMATMDLITFQGGKPANFLDLGGGATKEQVLRSFQLLQSDPNVKAIFVNIFGGITRCDVVAQGIVESAQDTGMRVPLVVRLVGNNAAQAKDIINSANLKASGINMYYEQDFAKASKLAVKVANSLHSDHPNNAADH